MSISDDFKQFCCNLNMSDSTVEKIRDRYHKITKRINLEYWGAVSDFRHSLYAGSYGRGTAIYTSDLDIIVELPWSIYNKYNDYTSNGQSQLLYNVRNALAKTYSTSKVKGDGQVVGISFSDGISFEIVPAFENSDKSYTHIDTNNGGKWKNTNPRSEISAMNELNKTTNGNLKRLCKMIRSWKNVNNVDMSGILIDTLAYRFIKQWRHKEESYLYYDWMSRDFFKFLLNESDKRHWLTPGSSRYIYKNGEFKFKAKKAYELANEATNNYKDYPNYSREKWREIYGTKFPV